MQWIERISRENAELVALVTECKGVYRHHPLSKLGGFTIPTLRHKSKLDTCFQEWKLVPSIDYIRGIALSYSVAPTHMVFKFSDHGVTYLLPAYMLFRAIFRPLNFTATYLFRPQGLDQIVCPTLDGRVTFLTPGLSKRSQNASTLQQPLSWMSCFPSAKRMWDSVYRHACNGVLGCDLPQGSARIVVRGIKNEELFFVTEMTILQVTTTEQPFDFAASHSPTILFHEGVAFRQRGKSHFEARPVTTINPVNGQWDLTDSEWNAIYPLFAAQETRGRAKRKHDLRCLINGIIAKLGTGTPWKKFPFQTGTWANASRLYGECQKNGRWQEIEAILSRSRFRCS